MNNIILIIILALILVFIVTSSIKIYNRLVMLNHNVAKNFANIDVILKQRADEIPELVKIVKKYMEYEEDLITKVTSLRTQYLNASKNDDKVKATNELNNTLANIMAVSENYPDLKANTSFLSLQGRVSELENHLADRRELYNDSVNLYNIGVNEFPGLLLAKPMGYWNKELLQISEKEKQYHGVQF
ncbi:LemA family protein [Zobellia alginiliquefaciens]|uniref:LemA family protein n=1 Tax=Zobellia alginiliquefaciens TaxID=3032586 RepID=UPI0023E41E09|nr:LemA family protein [Zobellia alginiliquefaciens]